MISFNLMGLIVTALGIIAAGVSGGAFLSKDEIADQSILRLPTSEGPPTKAYYLKTAQGQRLLKARRWGFGSLILLLLGVLFQITGQFWQ